MKKFPHFFSVRENKDEFPEIIWIKIYVPCTRERRVAQHSRSLLWLYRSLLEPKAGAWAQGCWTSHLPPRSSACPPKCRATVKEFAPGSSSTKGFIDSAQGTVSGLCGSTEDSSICSPETPFKSQEVHKNTKITMCGKKTASLTGSSAFLLCVEFGCIWLNQGHCSTMRKAEWRKWDFQRLGAEALQ